MPLRRSLVLALASLSVSCPIPLCQVGGGGSSAFVDSITGKWSLNPRISGHPFSAEMVKTTVQTLADGTQITQRTKRFEARDSAGRTRTEIYLPDRPGSDQNPSEPLSVSIFDPVGQQSIDLNPRAKIATINQFATIRVSAYSRPIPAATICIADSCGPVSTAQQQQKQLQASIPSRQLPVASPPLVEKLGGERIAGIYAEGTRITQVTPAGAIGNNRDITTVSERWVSPELQIDVLVKVTDPRSGDSTAETENLSTAEPDPTLFQIPSDYKLQTPQQQPN
jgi:hypothetical protein